MAKTQATFACQECGSIYSKWTGRCSACGAWDSVIEETPSASYTVSKGNKSKKLEFDDLAGAASNLPRDCTGMEELDRVLGGGLVPGSAILLGGDPGIGKSTLLLQVVASLGASGKRVAYISGEESLDQVRLRARRLGLHQAPVGLLTATSVRDIVATLDAVDAPQIVIIDSIQTMFDEAIASAPGTVAQVRACAHMLITLAKRRNTTVILVGHVTKEGQIAGPKVLEHMVDTVLYFEGERGHQFRILRAVKNRFGGANEIGVFEMREEGLVEVKNPSALFLSEREESSSGSCVFAGMEGSRPVLVEIQALIAPSFMAQPRRAVVGWDANRLAMVIAILNTRYGLSLADKEVYLNVAGGLRINEPAADLAVAAALISAALDIPLTQDMVIFGEMGLSGEIRRVSQAEMRLREAEKLGFHQAIAPKGTPSANKAFILKEIRHIRELAEQFRQMKRHHAA